MGPNASVPEFERAIWAALLDHLQACHDPEEDLQIDISAPPFSGLEGEYEERYLLAKGAVEAKLFRLSLTRTQWHNRGMEV